MAAKTTVHLLILSSLAVFLSLVPKIAGGGVCYTSNGSGLPSAKDVVSLYHQHHFKAMRLYEPDPDALRALRGSGIQVTVGVPNKDLEQIAADFDSAHEWIQANIMPHFPGVLFKYIVVGDEAVGGDNARFVMVAMSNLHKALTSVGLAHQIKLSTAVSAMTILRSSSPPSSAAFSESSRAYMVPIVNFLADHDAPLLANVHPYFGYQALVNTSVMYLDASVENKMDVLLSYALFLAESDIVVDGQFGYRNLFDAMIDGLYAALEKVGAPDVRIVVSETGWPSAATGSSRAAVATVANAKTYIWNLCEHVASGRGTPRRPGGMIETYIFAMFADESKHTGENFGLFYPNKKAIYELPVM